MNLSEAQKKSYEMLINLNFEESLAFELSKRYSPLEFNKASDYFNKQKEKYKGTKREIVDKSIYFQSILKRKYWEYSK